VGKGQTEMMIPPPFDEALMMIDDHRENLNLCSGILFYFWFFVEVVEISFRFCNKEAKNNTITQGEERAFFPGGGETRKSNNHHHFIELRKIGEKMANY
jgi:hypothetical protein